MAVGVIVVRKCKWICNTNNRFFHMMVHPTTWRRDRDIILLSTPKKKIHSIDSHHTSLLVVIKMQGQSTIPVVVGVLIVDGEGGRVWVFDRAVVTVGRRTQMLNKGRERDTTNDEGAMAIPVRPFTNGARGAPLALAAVLESIRIKGRPMHTFSWVMGVLLHHRVAVAVAVVTANNVLVLLRRFNLLARVALGDATLHRGTEPVVVDIEGTTKRRLAVLLPPGMATTITITHPRRHLTMTVQVLRRICYPPPDLLPSQQNHPYRYPPHDTLVVIIIIVVGAPDDTITDDDDMTTEEAIMVDDSPIVANAWSAMNRIVLVVVVVAAQGW
jgi:hypothetical protein